MEKRENGRRGLAYKKATKRHCNYCKKPLPQDRYFNHKECIAEIQYDGDYLYGSVAVFHRIASKVA